MRPTSTHIDRRMTDEERRAKGRPRLPAGERRDLFIKIRATKDEAAQFAAVGGADWFRQALKRALARLKGGKAGG